MAAVRQQRAAVVPFIVEGARLMAVINGRDETPANRASCIFDPAACVQACLRLMAFLEGNSLLAEILLDCGRTRLSKNFSAQVVLKGHIYFAQFAVLHQNAMRGESIQQFV